MIPTYDRYSLYTLIDPRELCDFHPPEYTGGCKFFLFIPPGYNGFPISESEHSRIFDKFISWEYDPDVPPLFDLELQCKVNVIGYCHYDRFWNILPDSNIMPAYIAVFVVPEFINGIPTRPQGAFMFSTPNPG